MTTPTKLPWNPDHVFRTKTKGGKEVIICNYVKEARFPWLGYIGNMAGCWTGDGTWLDNGVKDNLDLLTVPLPPEPKKMHGFIQVVKQGDQYFTATYCTEEFAANNTVARIDLSQLEEGHGLTDEEKARLR